jgi:hypothetical protein
MPSVQRPANWLQRALQVVLAAALAITVIASAAAWLAPSELIQDRAIRRAGQDPYAQFEAAGQAEAMWWLLQWVLPVLAALCLTALRRPAAMAAFVRGAASGFLEATSRGGIAVRVVQRGAIGAWLGLSAFALGVAVQQRCRDWPYYRLRAGPDVLPNISESNREVIRYLNGATPPGARIFAVSDQKLFFVSYYALPRRLYQRTHPASEFTIPQPDQQRQLAAYRLSDIEPEYLQRLKPDFVLEYFEGGDYVERERVREDGAWLEFQRQRRGDATYVPPYVVVLRPYAEVIRP